MSPSPRHAPSALRYRLAPDPAAKAAMEATFSAYDRMMEILEEVARTHNVGSNVVLLHAHAYDPIRKEYGMPGGTPVTRATALPARSAFPAADVPPRLRGEVEA